MIRGIEGGKRAAAGFLLLAAACSAERTEPPQSSAVSVTPVAPAVSAPVSMPSSASAAAATVQSGLTPVHFSEGDELTQPEPVVIGLAGEDRSLGVGSPSGKYLEPHISEDGAIGLDIDKFNATRPGYRIRTYRIDTGDLADDMTVVEEPYCDELVRKKCDLSKLEESIRRANKVLKKHVWARLRTFTPLPLLEDTTWCDGVDVSRHALVDGHEIHFTPPYLRIVRQKDGAVVVDRKFPWREGQQASAGACTRDNPPVFAQGGIDLKRRAMFMYVESCRLPECGGQLWLHFFRLPPPMKP